MTVDKYLARTNKNGSCMEWMGAKATDGYPRVAIKGDYNVKLHRHVYRLLHPDEDITGKVIRHTCDNPVCINPEHLLSGTAADNMRDRDTRGHLTLAKTTADDVRLIRRLYSEGKTTQAALADQFNLNHRTIHYIVHRKTWTWVD